MTIVDAFNEITVAQGGTPNYSGTIAGAIDALNDALAGSDQPSAQTIEGAVRLLGEHIGGGSSVTVEALSATENKTYTAPEGKAYSPVTVNVPTGPVLGSLLNVLNASDEDMTFTVTASDDIDDGMTADPVCNLVMADNQAMQIAAGLYLALDIEAVVKKVEGTPEVRTTVNPDKTYDDEGVNFYLIPEVGASVHYEVSW